MSRTDVQRMFDSARKQIKKCIDQNWLSDMLLKQADVTERSETYVTILNRYVDVSHFFLDDEKNCTSAHFTDSP